MTIGCSGCPSEKICALMKNSLIVELRSSDGEPASCCSPWLSKALGVRGDAAADVAAALEAVAAGGVTTTCSSTLRPIAGASSNNDTLSVMLVLTLLLR